MVVRNWAPGFYVNIYIFWWHIRSSDYWAFQTVHVFEAFKTDSNQLLKSWRQKYWTYLVWERMPYQYWPLYWRCTCETSQIVLFKF
jgi:hypothetical protein